MARVGCNYYFLFSAIFSPFTPPPPPSRPPKILQKWKKHLKVSAFTTSVLKIMIICFIVPEIWHLMDVVVSFNFGLFFAILPHLTAQKMKKHTWRYHNFTQLYQKSWSYAILFLRYGLLGIELLWYVTDGLMDRKSDIQRWVPHLKKSIFRTECNCLWDEKKRKQENCKSNSLIQTLVYRSIPNLSKGEFRKQ